MGRRRKQVLYGWGHEDLPAKIRRMLALSLSERYRAGWVGGELAKRLERNQRRLYGSRTSRRIQILRRPPG